MKKLETCNVEFKLVSWSFFINLNVHLRLKNLIIGLILHDIEITLKNSTKLFALTCNYSVFNSFSKNKRIISFIK